MINKYWLIYKHYFKIPFVNYDSGFRCIIEFKIRISHQFLVYLNMTRLKQNSQ